MLQEIFEDKKKFTEILKDIKINSQKFWRIIIDIHRNFKDKKMKMAEVLKDNYRYYTLYSEFLNLGWTSQSNHFVSSQFKQQLS